MNKSRSQFDIVIVGAGPAGLAAADAAVQSNSKVALIDSAPWLGGQIWRGEESRPKSSQAQKWIKRVRRSGVTLLDETSVIGTGGRQSLIVERSDGPSEIIWGKLILATGARELFLPFPGWTLPGVIGQGGLLSLVKNGWPIAGKKVVVAGSGPLLLAATAGLKKHGARIVSIAEQADAARILNLGRKLMRFPAKLFQGATIKASLLGIPHRCGVWPLKAYGQDRIQTVELTNGQESWIEACDVLTCGFHLVPNLELPVLLGCALSDGFVGVNEWQCTSVENVYCAGEPVGIGGADCALIEGQIAGYAASGQLDRARELFARRRSWQSFRAALAEAFALRPELKTLATEETLFCRCEDVAFGRVKQFGGWREAKLQTRCGMGACQGRTCGAAAKFILGWGTESVRPPILPARIQSLLIQNNQPTS